jgi:hypothetical protein
MGLLVLLMLSVEKKIGVGRLVDFQKGLWCQHLRRVVLGPALFFGLELAHVLFLEQKLIVKNHLLLKP